MKRLLAGFVCLLAWPAAASDIAGIKVALPTDTEWKQITNQSDDKQYIREWIPSGSDISNFKWIIAEQKLSLAPGTSPKHYLEAIKDTAKTGCPTVVFEGPHEVKMNSVPSFWMQYVCNKYKDHDNGSFIDQRYIFSDATVYVVTSELRTASSPVAGMLEPGKTEAEAKAFMARMAASTKFAREGIQACPSTGCGD